MKPAIIGFILFWPGVGALYIAVSIWRSVRARMWTRRLDDDLKRRIRRQYMLDKLDAAYGRRR